MQHFDDNSLVVEDCMVCKTAPNTAREEYRKDTDDVTQQTPGSAMFSVDLQKVVMLPRF